MFKYFSPSAAPSMFPWPAHSPHKKAGKWVGKTGSSCSHLPWGAPPPPRLSPRQPRPEPEACCGGDLSLLSPVPLPPPAWLYKTVITKSGTQLLPGFHRSAHGPPCRGRGKGPGFWVGMALRGLGIQREPSQQGPPGLGRRQVPGINIYFLTSWC